MIKVRQLIESELVLVEEELKRAVSSSGPEIKAIGEYISSGQGKRIRPALFLLAAQRESVSLSSLAAVAAAFELLHTASLLHDDVIDQAAMRRGKKTVHLHWTNKIAILSGDFLLSRVFKILAETRHWPLLDIVVDLAQKLSEGEIEQAFCDLDTPDLEERYFAWIGKKSAAFFAGCCEAGSLLGGDAPAVQQIWSRYGYNLGIAFQLVDDLLDYTGNDKVTGKPLYGDLKNRVLTLPLIRALDESGNNTKHLLKSFLGKEASSKEELSAVAAIVCQSSGIKYTFDQAGYYLQEAVKEARLLPVTEEKQSALEKIAAELMNRRR